MSDKIEILNEVTEKIRRINAKFLLLSLLSNAKEECEKSDFSAGRKFLIQALLLDKKNANVLRALGYVKQQEGKLNSAIRYYNMALKYSNKKEVEYTLIGLLYYYQDKLDDALIYFNRAIDENDNYDKAYEAKNQTMLEQHLKILDLQEALKKHL